MLAQVQPAFLRACPEAGPDADCGGRLIPVVPERAAGPVWLPALQAELLRALPPELLAALHPVLREVSRRESPEALRLKVRKALLPVLGRASPELLQPVASWVPASAQRQVLADARHRDVAVSRHARRARPEAHPADAIARARSMAHRRAVSRPMVPVLRRVLVEAALRGARPEAAEVQSSARAQPSELPLVAEGQP